MQSQENNYTLHSSQDQNLSNKTCFANNGTPVLQSASSGAEQKAFTKQKVVAVPTSSSKPSASSNPTAQSKTYPSNVQAQPVPNKASAQNSLSHSFAQKIVMKKVGSSPQSEKPKTTSSSSAPKSEVSKDNNTQTHIMQNSGKNEINLQQQPYSAQSQQHTAVQPQPSLSSNPAQKPNSIQQQTGTANAIQSSSVSKAQSPPQSDADTYFRQNPILTEQFIENKKTQLKFSPISPLISENSTAAGTLVTVMKDLYSKSYQRLVELRKAGFDTGLVQILVYRVPAKIKIYEASQDEKDRIIAKRYLNEAIEELNILCSGSKSMQE